MRVCDDARVRVCEGAAPHVRTFVCLLAASLGLSATSGSAQRSSLTGAPRLARVYDAIFDARFDEVPKMLTDTCGAGDPGVAAAPNGRGARAPRAPGPPREPRAPAEVCQLLDVVSLWWEMQLDPDDTSRDAAFAMRVDAAITAIDTWTTREPARAEAWFYLGGAYGARAQFRVLRGDRLAAARDGKRIKEALERALSLDPSLDDAYFGIGLYHYYAAVAPAAARMLRWLLALPGGDKVKGLEEMLRARQGGQLLRGEADYQLHLIYLWYEKQPARALELLHGLAAVHPRNPRFPQLVAEVEDVYLHDHAASLRTWRRLFADARDRRVAEPGMTEVRARMGIAVQLDSLFETDAAVDELKAVIASRPAVPFGAVAEAHLQLGAALDRLGYEPEADDAYRAAIASAPPGDPLDAADRAKAGMRQRRDRDTAVAYRLSLDGWRALERGALDEASRALTASLALRPDDQVTWYRQARLLDAENHDEAALDLFERVIGAGAATPPTFYAAACLDAARLYEQRREVARARELYQRARTADRADERTRASAARAIARLASPADASR